MSKFISRTLSIRGLGDIIVETGKFACRADASILIKYNGTVLLTTVVCCKRYSDCDFLPLHVDYQEKFFSVGKIPQGGKREGKLNDYEVLISRLIDRGIRPMLEYGYNNDTQVTITLLSSDKTIIPESLACFASSLALLMSPAAFSKPVSEVFVYLIDGIWYVNPSIEHINASTAKIIVGSDGCNLIMLEGTTNELPEDKIIEGIDIGIGVIKQQCDFQKEFIKLCDTVDKIKPIDEDIITDDRLVEAVYTIYAENIKSKKARDTKLEKVFEEYKTDYIDCKNSGIIFKSSRKKALKKLIKDKNTRIDGRQFDQIRDISCDVDYLPMAHGSALFTRGETQALATVTLGDKKDEAFKEGVLETGTNKLFLHYNFPSYSVGETGGLKSASRREIGHGQLALNGLLAVIPTEENGCLYTIRIVSDILSSNGSSSMATACASSLALMDAGIKIKKQVAGIAMGLVMNDNGFYVLSDINGDEDELGDMDFKVIGTSDGITAIQLDVKCCGLTTDILKKALVQAKNGRLFILDKMNTAINHPREQVKDFAPCFGFINVPHRAIGQIIGVGGAKIQSLMRETNSFIYISENENGGIVKIYSKDRASLQKCEKLINENAVIPVEGNVYDGTVTLVQDFGAYVEFLSGKIGLLKISDLDWCQVDNMHNFLHVGDKIDVKLMKDFGNGKYLLSHKVLLQQRTTNDKDAKKAIDRIPDNI